MRWLTKNTNRLIIKEINESDKLPEALGITEDRMKELCKITERSVEDTSTFSAAMEKLSLDCQHANELGYCCMVIGQMIAGESIKRQLKEQGIIKDD